VNAPEPDSRIVLVRHGETEWSATGRHTSRTDVPLTGRGQSQAEALGRCLQAWRFALVLTSPLQRAAETCRLAGLGGMAVTRPEVVEWDYGDYEGLTTPQIRERRPGWSLWSDGVPEGEAAEQVSARADRALAEAREAGGDVALFSHGHFLRVIAARWIDLPAEAGRRLALDTASISVLGYERETPVIVRWNQPCSEPAEVGQET
jgi:broad specificity phosphatase PhoE